MLLWESLLGGSTIPATPLLFIWGSGQGGQLADATSTGSPLNLSTVRSWSQVTGNTNSAMAIRNDGLLFAWGTNLGGVLGNGTTVQNLSPTQIGTSSWTAVAMGTTHALAIRQGGTLFSWGANTQGQLGLGDTNSRSSPTQIGTSSWTALAFLGASSNASGAIRQGGTLFTWGQNSPSILGDGTSLNRSSPTQIGTSSWVAVTFGPSNASAIRQGGTLFSWGSSSGGKLGNYINGVTPPTAQSWREVAYYRDGGFGIDSLSRLWAWSFNNSDGLLGVGVGPGTSIGQSPLQVGTESYITVRADGSQNFALAIRTNNTLWSWGKNFSGQLGLGDQVSRSSPTQVGTSLWTQVSVCEGLGAAIRQDGRLFIWGQNDYGQIPLTTGRRSSPVQIGTSSWSQVALGRGSVYVRRIDNTLWSWGENAQGELGLADSTGAVVPAGQSWIVLASAYDSIAGFAISNTGSLWSWGQGNYGLSGRGSVTDSIQQRPTPIDSNSWVYVDAGYYDAMAIRQDRTLWSWGWNLYGALGLGDFTARSFPAQVGTSSWTTVAVGQYHTLGIRRDGTLWAWGDGGGYRLGLQVPQGTTASPVQVLSGSWNAVAAGNEFSLAIRQDGAIYTWGTYTNGNGFFVNEFGGRYTSGFWDIMDAGCSAEHALGIQESNRLFVWGQNNHGQLGLGSTFSNIDVPVTVAGTWTTKIAGGFQHSAAIDPLGRLFAWGRNDFGQLGLGDTINRSSPTQIGTSSWTQVYAGFRYTAAIRQDGRLFMWGVNADGQLGLGNNLDRSSPTQVGTSSWTQVDFKLRHTLGIRQGGTMFTWGLNTWGQLGDSSTISRSSPVQIGTSSWTQVSAGLSTSAALRQDARGFTWGYNDFYGALGQGDQVNRSSPQLLSTGSSLVIISMGDLGGIAVDSNFRRAEGWGGNFNGEFLFRWTGNPQRTPTNGFGDASATYSFAYAKVTSANSGGTFGILTSTSPAVNQRAVFGGGNYQLGFNEANGSTFESPKVMGLRYSMPNPIRFLPGTSWTLIAAGNAWAMAWANGTNYPLSWGSNQSGQLGLGDNDQNASRSSPSQIGGLQAPIISLKAKGSSGSGVGFLARMHVWGTNILGQAGQNPNTSPYVASANDPWPFIWSNVGDYAQNLYGFFGTTTSAGPQRLLWLGGQDWADPAYWNNLPYVARSSPTLTAIWNSASPNQIGTGSWTWVAAGSQHAGAISASSQAWTWGYNVYGQLGTGDTVNRSSPTQIEFGQTRTRLVMGSLWTQIWRDTGYLAFTGYNGEGVGGLGDTISRSSPQQLTSPDSTWGPPPYPDPNGSNNIGWGFKGTTNSWVALTWGQTFTPSISQAWWTTNLTPSFTDVATVASPVQVGTLSWSQVGVGERFSAARGSNNLIYVWGIQEAGAGSLGLGLSITTTRGSPVALGASSYTQISVATSTVLAIKTDGTMVGWGIGTSGQLGNNANENRSSPVVAAAGSWTQVHAMPTASLGISADNRWLYGWSGVPGSMGQGYSPVIINGNALPYPRLIYESIRRSPIQLGTASWRQVSNDYLHSLAISSDNKLWAWGWNRFGQLGNNVTANPGPSSPIQIGSENWKLVSTGGESSLAIRQDNTLWAWGFNGGNQLGLGDAQPRSSPTQVGTLSWKQVMVTGSSTLAFTLAIRQDDTLWSWGFAQNGSLGQGVANQQIASPVQIGTSSWSAIGTIPSGGLAVAAIRIDGALFTWGLNSRGQLGLQDFQNRSSPTQVGTSSWIAVSMGLSHAMGLTRVTANRGTLFAWGSKLGGAIGNGDTVGRSWTGLTLGSTRSLSIDSQGFLWGAGNNSVGELGLGDTFSRSDLSLIGAPNLWRSAVSTTNGTLAIRQDNTLWAWGQNNSGQLGLGDTNNRSSPVQIGTSSWTRVAAGGNLVLAIRQDGTLWWWGTSQQGANGDGVNSGTVNRSSPLQIGSNTWSNVVNNRGTWVLATRATGALFAWGANGIGELGLGDTNSRSSPTQVGTSSWTALGSASNAGFAIRQGGNLFAWGQNFYGELGLGDTIYRSSPTQVGTSSWTALAFTGNSNNHMFGIINGALYAWGLNNQYQLGVTLLDTNNRSSPTFVSSVVTSWTAVAAASNVSGGISTTDAQIYGWGIGNNGQFGDQTRSNRLSPTIMGSPGQFIYTSPVQIGSQQWKSISAGFDVSAAINSADLLYTWGVVANGQLGGPGAGSFVARSSPVQVGTSSWTAVNLGSQSVTGITK